MASYFGDERDDPFNLPYVYGDTSVIAGIPATARTSPCRLLIIGDSTSTPNGLGSRSVAKLNSVLGDRFGNCGSGLMPWQAGSGGTGRGTDGYGGVLNTDGSLTGAANAAWSEGDELPWGLAGRDYGDTANASGDRPFYALYSPQGSTGVNGGDTPVVTARDRVAETVTARVYAVSNGHTLSVQPFTRSNAALSWFVNTADGSATTQVLDDAGSIHAVDVALTQAADKNVGVWVDSTSNVDTVTIIGVEFIRGVGVSIASWSAGGRTLGSHADGYGDVTHGAKWREMLATHDPSYVLILLGTNDALQAATIGEVKTDLENLLDQIRVALPNTGIIVGNGAPIDNGQYKTGTTPQLTSAQWDIHVGIPQAIYDVVNNYDDGVCGINLRRELYDRGWIPRRSVGETISPSGTTLPTTIEGFVNNGGGTGQDSYHWNSNADGVASYAAALFDLLTTPFGGGKRTLGIGLGAGMGLGV